MTWRPDDADQELKDTVWDVYCAAKADPTKAFCVVDERDPTAPVVWLTVDRAHPFTVPEGVQRLDG